MSPEMTIEDVGGKLGSRDMFVRAVAAMVRRTRAYVRQWTRHRINHKIQQNDTLKVSLYAGICLFFLPFPTMDYLPCTSCRCYVMWSGL